MGFQNRPPPPNVRFHVNWWEGIKIHTVKDHAVDKRSPDLLGGLAFGGGLDRQLLGSFDEKANCLPEIGRSDTDVDRHMLATMGHRPQAAL